VTLVEHVGTGQNDGAGHEFGIVGGQQAAFAGIEMLVGLGRKATRQPETAALAAIPGSPHGVGAILDQNQIVFSDDGSELLHVGQMTAHV
jgi:hypothetical protein